MRLPAPGAISHYSHAYRKAIFTALSRKTQLVPVEPRSADVVGRGDGHDTPNFGGLFSQHGFSTVELGT